MTRASLLLPLLMLAACAADTTISLAGFDKSCAEDADCAVVTSGDICGCNCGNDAINRAGLARYQAELQDKQMHCPGPGMACDCVFNAAGCTQGQCVFKKP